MGFKNDIPNYKSYQNGEFHLSKIPSSIWGEIEGLILRAGNNSSDLKQILDEFARIIPCSPTTNWGYDFLKGDVWGFVVNIKRKTEAGKIDVLMDCLACLITLRKIDYEDINDFLDDHSIGYECYYENFSDSIFWNIRESISEVVDDIDVTKKEIKSTSQQAFDEFSRAQKQFEDVHNERARKDAVRSCASALEAVVKVLGGANDIGEATTNLRNENCWGHDSIVKEGLSIFNTLHRLYPDLRHGSTETSSMTKEVSEYWIGRMSNYIRYMQKVKTSLGKE